MKTLTRAVARRALAGDDLDSINNEVIEARTDLSKDRRAAAWLYGWSLQESARLRRESDKRR